MKVCQEGRALSSPTDGGSNKAPTAFQKTVSALQNGSSRPHNRSAIRTSASGTFQQFFIAWFIRTSNAGLELVIILLMLVRANTSDRKLSQLKYIPCQQGQHVFYSVIFPPAKPQKGNFVPFIQDLFDMVVMVLSIVVNLRVNSNFKTKSFTLNATEAIFSPSQQGRMKIRPPRSGNSPDNRPTI